MNSIFSTQNNANSIAQIALAKKQQENSGVKFSNVLKGQIQSLGAMVDKNKMTLAKATLSAQEILATTANLSSQNATTSLSQSDIFALKIEFQNKNTATSPLTQMLASLNENATNPTLYGYSVDSKGFMGADFNTAAGLPQNFKIHSNTVQTLYELNANDSYYKQVAQYYGRSSYFANIDIAYTFKYNYEIFSQIAGASFGDKTTFSKADLAALPKGYSINKVFDPYEKNAQMPKLTTLYKDEAAYKEAETLDSQLFANNIEVLVGARRLEWSAARLDGEKTGFFDPDFSVYKDGENYTLEGLFVAFMDGDLKGGGTQIDPYIEAMQKSAQDKSVNLVSLDKIMSGEVDLMQILKSALEKGLLDANIYANERGQNLATMQDPTEIESFWNDFDSKGGYKPSTSIGTAYISNLYKEFMPKIQAHYAKYGV